MRRVLRPIRLGALGTCLLITLAMAAAAPAAGSSAQARPWLEAAHQGAVNGRRSHGTPACSTPAGLGGLTG